ncbi:hypothetical protein AGR3A_Lc80034 [Agrobacterium tomkonis CFBP 6623]|uniref:Uncharacterized protein n=1 Tax=Agrobacterium tomkonis CFBP 6623 TaxID=1183432 RepID=A0A1S7S6X8_9HYPH|nr:hypothetical protein AGR3A_Lc80034 [Agrobacterium tomkonis CFBP 6623]
MPAERREAAAVATRVPVEPRRAAAPVVWPEAGPAGGALVEWRAAALVRGQSAPAFRATYQRVRTAPSHRLRRHPTSMLSENP